MNYLFFLEKDKIPVEVLFFLYNFKNPLRLKHLPLKIDPEPVSKIIDDITPESFDFALIFSDLLSPTEIEHGIGFIALVLSFRKK